MTRFVLPANKHEMDKGQGGGRWRQATWLQVLDPAFISGVTLSQFPNLFVLKTSGS